MKLYDHQEKALAATKGVNRVAYYLDMGLGKTFVGSEKLRELGYPINLIVCQKSKISDWCDHLNSQYPGLKVLDLTRPSNLGAFHQYAAYRPPFCVAAVINYELLWRRAEFFQHLTDYALMLDESSLIQNEKSKQTKFILKLTPSAVVLLSGTPTAGKYERLWSQAHLLGWDISRKTYDDQYVNYRSLELGDGTMVRVVDKAHPYRNVDRLKRKLREHGAIFMKTEDVMDMPEQVFTIVKVDAPREYRQFIDDGIVTIGGDVIVGDTTLTKRLRARQLCGEYAADKAAAFRDLVQSTQDRLVVFYNFTPELEILRAVCESLDRPVSVINGQIKDLTAYEVRDDSVTLCQYQAGAMGLNLQKSNKIVYFTLPERSELFEQSKKRTHRIGQNRSCYYWVLECRNTIEPIIRRTLEQRKDFTDELFREALEAGGCDGR